ncbi:hypothetical protein HN682_10265 [Candidatus Peregrinibacteria bacterium]|jgi:hypothetical protein|nr:hypothetical protein [Candidatus Peregrinibacteria bacterium]
MIGRDELRKEVEKEIQERIEKSYKEELDLLLRRKQVCEGNVKQAQKNVVDAEIAICDLLEMGLDEFADSKRFGTVRGNIDECSMGISRL